MGALLTVAGLALATMTVPVAAATKVDPDAQAAARRIMRAAFAKSMAATTFTAATSTDPASDVTDARADITNVTATYTTRALKLSVTIPNGTDPRTDDLWQGVDEHAEIEFAIASGNEPYPDFIASLTGGPRHTISAGIFGYFEEPQGDCTGVTGRYRNHVYTVVVPSDCFANPPRLRVAAGMIIFNNSFFPFPIEEDPIIDVAPDHGTLKVSTPPGGYRLVSDDGGVFAFGSHDFRGSLGALRLARPIADAAGTPSGKGYLMVGEDGGVFRFGDAPFAGSAAGLAPNDTFVAVALTPSGHGYWLLSASGGVFTFGDARFRGAMPVPAANAVDITPTATGNGYYVATADGGVLAFGDAGFRGSAFGLPLGAPIAAVVAVPNGTGYRLFGRDGGVFSFGTARYFGASGGHGPVVDAVGTTTGQGYTTVASNGAVRAFGDARWFGDAEHFFKRRPMVAIAG